MLFQKEVVGHVVNGPSQVMRIELVTPKFVDIVVSAVFAPLLHGNGADGQGVRLGQQVGVEVACDVGHVDHTALDGIAHLERRHDFGATAQVVDLDRPLAFCIDFLDELFKVLREKIALRPSAHRLDGDLLREHGGSAQRHGAGGGEKA